MSSDVIEEDLLRSIEEVEAKILHFRRRVRAVLADVQSEGQQASAKKKSNQPD